MIKNKIGIFTYHKIVNNGAILHAYSVQKKYSDALNDTSKVKIIDHQFKTQKYKKFLKIFKLYRQKPFFNLRRYIKFHNTIKNIYQLDQMVPNTDNQKIIAEYLNNSGYEKIITTMDVWNVTNKIDAVPNITNIHWLPSELKTQKIAYSVSAHRSDPKEIKNKEQEITKSLSGFNAIGARDDFTLEFVKKYCKNQDTIIKKVPDPTFMYEIKKTKVEKKLSENGVNLKKPIAGILIYGKHSLSKKIVSHLKKSGYQVIGLSMFNKYVDINFGDLLDPFEWAEAFKYLDVCISDRFHGSVFALKNNTPFICIEPAPLPNLKFSKLLNLMREFELEDNHINTFNKDFKIKHLLNKIDTLKSTWNRNQIAKKNSIMKDKCNNFVAETIDI